MFSATPAWALYISKRMIPPIFRFPQLQFAALDYGEGFYIEATVRYTPQIPLLNLTPAFIILRARHYGIIERID